MKKYMCTVWILGYYTPQYTEPSSRIALFISIGFDGVDDMTYQRITVVLAS